MLANRVRCVGGPYDGEEVEGRLEEFQVATAWDVPGRETRAGVYRYDHSSAVYRWAGESFGERGRDFEKEADSLVYEGAWEEAKRPYGWAIDAYLDVGLYEEAIRTCRKLIRVAPDVVRTRYTLAFLLTGRGRHGEAHRALTDYASAITDHQLRSYAVPRLQLLAQATDDSETLALLGKMLQDLGAEIVPQTPSGSDISGLDANTRWERLLYYAVREV